MTQRAVSAVGSSKVRRFDRWRWRARSAVPFAPPASRVTGNDTGAIRSRLAEDLSRGEPHLHAKWFTSLMSWKTRNIRGLSAGGSCRRTPLIRVWQRREHATSAALLNRI
jgi:hypothetical protein